MFGKRKQEPQAQPAAGKVKLTAAEKREIRRIIETARGDGKPHSAQDTLPFRQMYPDGLCRLDDTTWSRCIEFEDVNYQLAQKDDQTAIFEALCDMYNAHDSSIGMELSLVCRKVNKADFRKRIEIAAQGDRFDGVRALYTDMLRGQLEHGNNGMVKTKVLVLSIEAKNGKEAVAYALSHNPDAVLMDIKMPVMDGIEALKEIRLHTDSLPAIMQTAYAFDTDRRVAEEAGCNGFITKPVMPRELKMYLDKYLTK